MTSFHSDWCQDAIKNYFNIKYIEDDISFNKQDSIIVSNLTEDRWYMDLYDQGYKLVIDLLWGGWDFHLPGVFLLTHPDWFWLNESSLYRYLGYHNYEPTKTYGKLALMPMGLIKPSHDMLFPKVAEYLDRFIYSYIERHGIYLPDDAPLYRGGQQQRHFNPMWYDDTYFSLVSETIIASDFPLHITEKTYKPIAYFHPFVIWGQPNLLSHLRNSGFETYGNLFDESYDLEIDLEKRLDIIIENIKTFSEVPYDSLTIEKTKYNHNRFFDPTLVTNKIINEIIYPMIEFFESGRQ